MFLLDVNVLLARLDRNHIYHERAKIWFHQVSKNGWATCPLTENGFIRIAGMASYTGIDGNPTELRGQLSHFCKLPGHQFWPDRLSLRDPLFFPKMTNSKGLTDLYLLALAVDRQAKLATFDTRIDPTILSGGEDAYFLIP